MADQYASTLQTIHQNPSNGQTSSFKNRTVHAPVNPCPKQTSPHTPTDDPLCSCLRVLRPHAGTHCDPFDPYDLSSYLLPPLTPDSWPVSGRRRTRNSPQSILYHPIVICAYVCVSVCVRGRTKPTPSAIGWSGRGLYSIRVITLDQRL